MFAELTPLSVATVALLMGTAVLVGFGKTAVSGVGMITVAIFAAVLPSRASTGVLLPLLLVGDVFAVGAYRAHADWRTLVRLIPAVAVGIVLGVVFVSRVDDTVMRRTIGVVVLLLLGMHIVTQRRKQAKATVAVTNAAAVNAADGPGGAAASAPAQHRAHPVASWGYGSMSGFTTMVANAGGTAMSLYLLSARFSVLGFLGTTAWFFFLINLFKVPFSVALGLITPASLKLDLLLAPAVVVGALIGRRVIRNIRQDVFEKLVLATTLLAGLNLLR